MEHVVKKEITIKYIQNVTSQNAQPEDIANQFIQNILSIKDIYAKHKDNEIYAFIGNFLFTDSARLQIKLFVGKQGFNVQYRCVDVSDKKIREITTCIDRNLLAVAIAKGIVVKWSGDVELTKANTLLLKKDGLITTVCFDKEYGVIKSIECPHEMIHHVNKFFNSYKRYVLNMINRYNNKDSEYIDCVIKSLKNISISVIQDEPPIDNRPCAP
jgi:hypothetical protein